MAGYPGLSEVAPGRYPHPGQAPHPAPGPRCPPGKPERFERPGHPWDPSPGPFANGKLREETAQHAGQPAGPMTKFGSQTCHLCLLWRPRGQRTWFRGAAVTAGGGLGGSAPPRGLRRGRSGSPTGRSAPTPSWPGPASPEFTERETEARRRTQTIKVTLVAGWSLMTPKGPVSQPRAKIQMTHTPWGGEGWAAAFIEHPLFVSRYPLFLFLTAVLEGGWACVRRQHPRRGLSWEECAGGAVPAGSSCAPSPFLHSNLRRQAACPPLYLHRLRG